LVEKKAENINCDVEYCVGLNVYIIFTFSFLSLVLKLYLPGISACELFDLWLSRKGVDLLFYFYTFLGGEVT